MVDDSVNNINSDENVGKNTDSYEEESVENHRPTKEFPQKVGINIYYYTHLYIRNIETSTSVYYFIVNKDKLDTATIEE